MRRNGQLLDTKYHVDMPFYGPEITLTPNNPIINQHNLKVVHLEDDELSSLVAQEVSKGKIVALAQGRMEYGPRALGHRSILADPRSYKMRERLNIVTKQRESFRPFAPMVKEEAAKKYFEVAEGAVYKHMLINVSVRNDARNELQAITHIDGTARVQTVSKREMPLIWNILDRLEHLISVPIVLNTSFNLKSMPIVCTEDDALNAYVTSDIDLLVINNYVIYK
jgi:carbamoyltransferase